MTIDDIKQYIVCINGGSGVIFQPANTDFTYILTAKHVFDDIEDYKGQISIDYFNVDQGSFVSIPAFLPNEMNLYPHPTDEVDIAIVRLQRIPAPTNQIFSFDLGTDREDYFLVGFPNLRRTTPVTINCIRHDNGLSLKGERLHSRREGTLPAHQNYEELVGTSGGGIFKISDDYLLLVGIQSRISEENESLGNIEYTPIKVFNEIAADSTEIEEILPCYMKDFTFLKEDAFELELTIFNEANGRSMQNYLRGKAQMVIETGITPKAIKEFFNHRLLVDDSITSTLYKSPIWIAWLEFLTIMNIVKYETFDEVNLTEIFNSIRLKYIDYKEDWTFLTKNKLLYSDYKGLPINGKVLVSTSKDPLDCTIIKPGQIPDIAKPYDKSKFKTDSGIHPFTHYTFVHTGILKKEYIVKKLDTYAQLPDDESILNALKEQYNELFG